MREHGLRGRQGKPPKGGLFLQSLLSVAGVGGPAASLASGRQGRGEGLSWTKGGLEACPDRRLLARGRGAPLCMARGAYWAGPKLEAGAKMRKAVSYESSRGCLGWAAAGSLAWLPQRRVRVLFLSLVWLWPVSIFSVSPSI